MSISINVNADFVQNRFTANNESEQIRANNKSFSLAHAAKDPIAERKAQAFEKARKIVSDAFKGEKKIDAELQELRDLSARLTEDNKEKLDQISQNKAEMDWLQQTYGVTEDSQEQKDLEILMKKNDSYYDPSVQLTEDEQKRYQEIMSEGQTEYQSRMMERHTENNRLQREMQENLAAIHANGSALRFVKGERLKSSPIKDAEDAAEKMLAAESDAIQGELVGSALDHMQEELQEKVEDAEKLAQQKAEKEEQIEQVQETVDEQKRQIEEVRKETKEHMQAVEPEDIINIQEQIQAEIDKVLEELKLLAEDLKGNSIDKLI